PRDGPDPVRQAPRRPRAQRLRLGSWDSVSARRGQGHIMRRSSPAYVALTSLDYPHDETSARDPQPASGEAVHVNFVRSIARAVVASVVGSTRFLVAGARRRLVGTRTTRYRWRYE